MKKSTAGFATLALALLAASVIGLASASIAQEPDGEGVAPPEPSTTTTTAPPAEDEEIILDKQTDFVATVCATVNETAEFVKRNDPLSDLQPDLEEQAELCDVAQQKVVRSTAQDVRRVGLKRDASAAVFAEYTGENRNEPSGSEDPPEDPPTWDPGDSTLSDDDFLGEDYKYNGDGDGVCARGTMAGTKDGGHGKPLPGYGEWCAEVIGDGLGDDDGFCEQQNPKGKEKKFEEACVELETTVEELESDDQNIDRTQILEYEQILDDGLKKAKKADATAQKVMESFEANRALAAESGGGTCPAAWERVGPVEIGIMNGVANAAASVDDIGFKAVNQTVVVFGTGGNVSASWAWASILKAATKVVANALEDTADADTAFNVTNTLKCLGEFRQETGGELQQMGDSIDALARIFLQSVELKEKSEYLVTATVNGQPLSGVAFTSVKVSPKNPIGFVEAGIVSAAEVPGAPGTYHLVISTPPGAKNVDLFTIQAEAATAESVIHGHLMFDRALTAGAGQ